MVTRETPYLHFNEQEKSISVDDGLPVNFTTPEKEPIYEVVKAAALAKRQGGLSHDLLEEIGHRFNVKVPARLLHEARMDLKLPNLFTRTRYKPIKHILSAKFEGLEIPSDRFSGLDSESDSFLNSFEVERSGTSSQAIFHQLPVLESSVKDPTPKDEPLEPILEKADPLSDMFTDLAFNFMVYVNSGRLGTVKNIDDLFDRIVHDPNHPDILGYTKVPERFFIDRIIGRIGIYYDLVQGRKNPQGETPADRQKFLASISSEINRNFKTQSLYGSIKKFSEGLPVKIGEKKVNVRSYQEFEKVIYNHFGIVDQTAFTKLETLKPQAKTRA